jgi:hypothetical protein
MAKQQLNGADIGAGFEQMDSKGVSIIPLTELAA